MKTIFFPRSDYDVRVCAHRHDKKMTYIEQTDTLQDNSINQVLELAKNYNIRVGAYIGRHAHSAHDEDVKKWMDQDLLRCDYYFPPKSSSDSSQVYTESEFNTLYNSNVEWFQKLNHERTPSVLSFGYGNRNYSHFCERVFLAGRGGYGGVAIGKDCHYGYLNGVAIGGGSGGGIDYWMLRNPCHGMWYDDAKTVGVESALDRLKSMINDAYIKGGMFQNFTHWHQMSGASGDMGFSAYDAYFKMLKSLDFYNDIHFCSYGEAIEYKTLREAIIKVSAYKPIGKDYINIVYVTNELSHLCNTPITVNVDLTNSGLNLDNLKCHGGRIVSKNGSSVMLDIPCGMQYSVRIF